MLIVVIVLSIYLLIFYVQAKTFAEFLIVGVKYKKPTNKAKKNMKYFKKNITKNNEKNYNKWGA